MDSGGIWPGDESYFQNIRETALQDTIEQLTKELAEARAENNVLKAALWYYGNRMGPNVGEELKNGLPEKIWRRINLREIEETDGEAAE